MVVKMGKGMKHRIENVVSSMGFFGGCFLIVMMVSITIDVACRYIFNMPLIWVYEVTGYLMVAVTFLALGYTELRDGHVSVDLLIPRLSPRRQATIKVVTRVPMLIFVFLLIWSSFNLALDSFETMARSYHFNSMLLWPSQMLVPLGGFLLFLQLLVKISGYIRVIKGGSA